MLKNSNLFLHNLNKIAYFCLEFGLESDLKTYAGGLGILAGDTAKAATDNNVDFIGITLLYHKGYFKQGVDNKEHVQTETDDTNNFQQFLELTDYKLEIKLHNKTVFAQVWKYDLAKRYPHTKAKKNAIYFIDTDIDLNNDFDRSISEFLYSSKSDTRTHQELVLGMGGWSLLKMIDRSYLERTVHLNESNAAFLLVSMFHDGISGQELNKRLLFTTHTPIPAGHKVYNISDLEWCFTPNEINYLKSFSHDGGQTINLTRFCLEQAGYTNGVAKRHMEVSSSMYPGYEVDYITNGIHSATWASPAMAELFNKYLPNWYINTNELRNAHRINNFELEKAHKNSKKALKEYLEENVKSTADFDTDIFTIGFARRVDPYKRHDFIVRDLARLSNLADKFDGLQVIVSGKAFPGTGGKQTVLNNLLEQIATNSNPKLKLFYIPNYSMEISKLMVSGCDIWLNNPVKPLEASGTSGMKAQLNGVPSLSTLDGWWPEGVIENVTGWSFGSFQEGENEMNELNDLFYKLENIILPIYYTDSEKWLEIMKNCISINGVHFSAQRMVNEYYKGTL
jgi:glycogen phosphorylase